MKIFLIIVGALMVLAGGACGTGGAALAIVVGGDGWINSDSGRMDTTTHALVSEVADIADEDPDGADFIDALEDFRFRFRAEPTSGEDDVFIGVGRASDVTAYLAGVEHDVVDNVEFDDLAIDKTLVPGTDEPEPPGEQSFWLESASGSGRQELDWEIRSGAYRFVLMNADGSAGVDVEAQFGLKIPYAMPIAIALMVAGGIVVLMGFVVIIIIAVRSTAPPPPPAQAASPPPATPPPTT